MTASDPLVGIIMGSQSDWPTLRRAGEVLDRLGIAWEARVISAHRTPERLHGYASAARSRGLKVILAGAGMAAALPGSAAALTPLPVLGIPIEGKFLGGLDALLSMVQMPPGIPVGTLGIGASGAVNAALLAAAILALADPALAARLDAYRAEQSAAVPEAPPDTA
jgi:5-(carboxyamino)imidazole ribonucleotide mutase